MFSMVISVISMVISVISGNRAFEPTAQLHNIRNTASPHGGAPFEGGI